MLLFFIIIINVLFGLVIVGIFIWVGVNNFGLFYLVDLLFWLEVLLGVMLLDLIV